MTLSDTNSDRAVTIALAGAVVVGAGMAFAHMLTDGDCSFAPLGPEPNTARECARAGGTWTPSTGFWHIAYEIGHVAFWPLIVLMAIVIALVLIRPHMPKPRADILSQ